MRGLRRCMREPGHAWGLALVLDCFVCMDRGMRGSVRGCVHLFRTGSVGLRVVERGGRLGWSLWAWRLDPTEEGHASALNGSWTTPGDQAGPQPRRNRAWAAVTTDPACSRRPRARLRYTCVACFSDAFMMMKLACSVLKATVSWSSTCQKMR